jgi:uncharacterized protein YgbK (DUF1537 family)
MTANVSARGPLIGFYGDDFTGSTDALEILALAGLNPVLVTDLDHAHAIPGLARSRAVGLAGISRSRSPDWMGEHLPAYFEFLKNLGVQICHYKVCSTFDSAPHIGNIGCALAIGQQVYSQATVPVVVGVPDLGRYQVFGTLFARAGAEVVRIDRHPTMKAHPVTPMAEADLRLHLKALADLSVDLIDIVQIASHDADRTFRAKCAEGVDALFLDVADPATSTRAGHLLWEALPRPAFVVGSSGVEYALTRHWQETGLAPGTEALPHAAPVDKVMVVSGSCSPATAAQIAWAQEPGFVGFRLDVGRLLDSQAESYLDAMAAEVLAASSAGRSTLVYSATGPSDPHLQLFEGALKERGLTAEAGNEMIGGALAAILRRVLPQTDCRRIVVAGGDTSGRVVGGLGITSLRMRAPLVRGAPLCIATATSSWADGLELSLKGGQVGGPDFFETARVGGADLRSTDTNEPRERRKGSM